MEAPYSPAKTEVLPLAACKVRPNGRRVLIVGGGGTGAALAYDLAQRGFAVTLLERGELTSGTTGRHHGQLHCGARYAWADRNIAKECYEESLTLSRIARPCIEYNGGFFVALGEEEANLPRFLDACAQAGIPTESVSPTALLSLEPRLSPAIRAAVRVPDGSFDAFRLATMFFAGAKLLGAKVLPWREVTGFEVSGGRIKAAIAKHRGSGREERFEADFVLTAAGAWTGKLGSLAGLEIPVTPAPGAMLAVRERVVDHVISRLRAPSDGDILVPQRGLSIIGSTQRLAEDLEGSAALPEETAFLLASGEELVPGFSSLPVQAAWTAARPLAGRASPSSGDAEGRSLSRDFAAIDHEAAGVTGFASLVGGKATVLRAMGELGADLVCSKLDVTAPCRTRDFALPSWRVFYQGRAP